MKRPRFNGFLRVAFLAIMTASCGYSGRAAFVSVSAAPRQNVAASFAYYPGWGPRHHHFHHFGGRPFFAPFSYSYGYSYYPPYYPYYYQYPQPYTYSPPYYY